MDRNVTTSVNRNIYSYQPSVNNNYTDSNNRINNNSYILSNQAISNLSQRSNENANLLEILNATDDSNLEEAGSNQEQDDCLLDYNFMRDQSLISQDNSSTISTYELFDSKPYSKKSIRPSSAPTKQNNEAEEFKYSTQFICLEKVIECSNSLIMKSDGKFDLDSEYGSEMFKVFLERLEFLIKVTFNIYTA